MPISQPAQVTESGHCTDLQGDRALGQLWENNFCVIAAKLYGKSFTAHQIGRAKSAVAMRFADSYHPLTLPDITLWSAPGEHHEIKHKKPHKFEDGSQWYGLEDYRLKPLKWFADETQQTVFYTIHSWASAGDRHAKKNRQEDWFTADINTLWQATLDGRSQRLFWKSWVGGEKRRVPGWLWPVSLWRPLSTIWKCQE